jgi:formate dehydrogenase maturation protein FdhE
VSHSLKSKWVAGYKQEIERCSKLYENFAEGAGFIGAVFEALEDYLKEQADYVHPVEEHLQDLEELKAKMRLDQSIRFRPEVDTGLFVALFKLVCAETVKVNPELKQVISQVVAKCEDYFSGYEDSVTLENVLEFNKMLVKETAMERDMATFLFSIVLSSIYRRQLENISEVLRTDLYGGGDCPLCGEKPHYGMLRAEDGAKQLECWLCGTSWVHTRVKCPYCNNEDREELGYFTVEGSDICRVNYCRSCCRYYKIFDARQLGADRDLILAIHHLASLDYDFLAGKEGFTSGSGLEWVNESELSDRKD